MLWLLQHLLELDGCREVFQGWKQPGTVEGVPKVSSEVPSNPKQSMIHPMMTLLSSLGCLLSLIHGDKKGTGSIPVRITALRWGFRKQTLKPLPASSFGKGWSESLTFIREPNSADVGGRGKL